MSNKKLYTDKRTYKFQARIIDSTTIIFDKINRLLGHLHPYFIFFLKQSKSEYEVRNALIQLRISLHNEIFSINEIIYFLFVHHSIMEQKIKQSYNNFILFLFLLYFKRNALTIIHQHIIYSYIRKTSTVGSPNSRIIDTYRIKACTSFKILSIVSFPMLRCD